MTKKKKSGEEENALPPLPTEVETLVVGGGPAGLAAFDALTGESKLLLESGDRLGGAAQTGLHLRPAQAGEAAYAPLRVRWDRKWTPSEEVDWKDKDWAYPVPQWSLYFGQSLAIWNADVLVAVERDPALCRLGAPVSAIDAVVGESTKSLWKLRTPEGEVVASHVIWAAGMTAFQNAFGKIEAQRLMTANPAYVADAADVRGGVGLDLVLAEAPSFEEGFDAGAVFGLPVRHGGKLYLCLGVVVPDGAAGEIRTLTHLPDEMLKDAKEMSSFQKSIRRTLKMITADEKLEVRTERCFVSARVAGHVLGTPWLLKGSEDGSLVFVGEESVGSSEAPAGAHSLGLHA